MSYTHSVKVAGMTFNVTDINHYVYHFCTPFRIKVPGDHNIVITQEDIDNERLIAQTQRGEHDEHMFEAPDYILETIAMLRKFADYICDYDRILMHGSAIAVNGNGYIFTALSGTGKSTHTALIRELCGENAVMINDDKPFLHLDKDQVYISGTPWMGKHNLGENITVPLKGIFFLYRSEENVLKKITPQLALMKMISQCHRPSDPDRMLKTFDIIDGILANVDLYDFGCNMDISAAELSTSVME